MKQGEIVNGYRIVRKPSGANAGQCMWSFAEKDGKEYFIKEFLRPTYPVPGAPGSDATKKRNLAKCVAFEERNQKVKQATERVSREGGNLVVTLAFFRHGTHYYKVTEKVDVAGLDVAAISSLRLADRLIILVSLAHSLKILHNTNIVHGDLKPANVLIRRTTKSYAAKLIDFDDSYFSAEPPPTDSVVGDPKYYSPELLGYVKGDVKAINLGVQSDIFALGILYCEYLSGDLPLYDSRFDYPCGAVRAGFSLKIPRGVPEPLRDLLSAMMAFQPGDRPSVSQVHLAVQSVLRPPRGGVSVPRDGRPPKAILRHNMGGRLVTRDVASSDERLAPPPPPPPPKDTKPDRPPDKVPVLKGKLADRRRSADSDDVTGSR